MPIVFEKSARSSMWLKLAHFIIVVIVCGALAAAGWYIDDWSAWIVIGLFLLIGIVIGISTWREMMIYSRARTNWRVEINDKYLVWQSPIQKIFQSFRINLDAIDSIQYFLVTSGGTKSRSSNRKFFIHLSDGKTMQIPAQEGGVWINDVFEALEQRGIRYDHQKMRNTKFNPLEKEFDVLPMTAWPS